MVFVKFLRDYEEHLADEIVDVGRQHHAEALVRGNIAVWADAGSIGAPLVTEIDGDDLVTFYDSSSNEERVITYNNFKTGIGAGHTGTTGSVFFAGAGGADSAPTEDNANLFWNDTDDHLGIGINAALDARLHIAGDITGTDLVKVIRSGTEPTADYVYIGDGTSDADFVITGDGRIGINMDTATINAQLRVTAASGGPNLAAAFIVDNNETDSTSGIQLFHDGTTGDAIDVVANSLTSATALDIDCDGLTTGSIARLISGSTSPANRELVHIHNDEAAATGAILLNLLQDSTGDLLRCRTGLAADDIRFAVQSTGHITVRPDQTTDVAPQDDTTVKKLSIQRLSADPTNAAFIKFSNSPGTPTDDFYLVLEEET